MLSVTSRRIILLSKTEVCCRCRGLVLPHKEMSAILNTELLGVL